jgi:hypothetical protein
MAYIEGSQSGLPSNPPIPGQFLIYDGSNVVYFSPRKHLLVWDDFLCNDGQSQLQWRVPTSGGTVSQNTDIDDGHPGTIQMQTGTGTTGYAGMTLGPNNSSQVMQVGGGAITLLYVVKIDNLSTGTDTFQPFVGLTSNQGPGGLNTQYVVAFSGDSNAHTNWQCLTNNNGTVTLTDSGVAVGTGWTTLQLTINAGGTSVQFYINGTSVATVTSNLPATGNTMSPQMWVLKSAGTTNRTMSCDIFWMFQALTSNR